MRVAIAGLGYVGTVTAACLAESGHTVVAVDVNAAKVAQLSAGESPVVEFGLTELVARNVGRGRLLAVEDLEAAVSGADISIVCVGTPTGENGDVNLADVRAVIEQVGIALRNAWPGHVVLVSSSVPPGTTDSMIVPLLEKQSGKTAGLDFGVAFSPEFLREGTAVADYLNPEKTVVGATDSNTYRKFRELLSPFTGDVVESTIAVAETVKFTDNAWHALKVAFANEIGRICDASGIDSHEVMTIFKNDRRLNISTAYLTPGFAFGGSCLPKDLRTLTYRARSAGVDVPVLRSILGSNRAHIDLALRKIEAIGSRSVSLLGLAFKPGTDDLRESPTLELAERLLGKGFSVAIHDEHVCPSRLVGANRDFVMKRLPHIASLLDEDLGRVLARAEVIVIAQASPLYANIASTVRPDQLILDLTGACRASAGEAHYRGLAW